MLSFTLEKWLSSSSGSKYKINKSHKSIFNLLFCILLFGLIIEQKFVNAQSVSASPGPRAEHCTAAYGNRFYVYSGNGNDQLYSWFSYIEAPFSVSNQKWVAMPTDGAHNVSRPACVVTENGRFFVIGGGQYDDVNYYGVSSYDLTKGTAGQWTDVKTNNLDSRSLIAYRDSHRAIYVKTTSGNELIFVFSGAFGSVMRNDSYILHLGNSSWEKVPDASQSKYAPPGLAFSSLVTFKDNIFVVSGSGSMSDSWEYYDQVWAFNIPTRTWFDPSVSAGIYFVGAWPGKLNDTFFFVSASSSSLNSIMGAWNLMNNSFTIFKTGPMAQGISHDYYSASQFAGSDVLITYGGESQKSSNASNSKVIASGYTSDLAIFNMTQRAWVDTCNVPTTLPVDKFAGGVLAPNQDDPYYIKSSNSNGSDHGGSSSPSNATDSAKNSSGLYIAAGVAAVVILGVGCFGFWYYRRRKNGDPNKNQGQEVESGNQLDKTQYPPVVQVPSTTPSTPKPEIYSHSVNNSSSDISLLSSQAHPMRVRNDSNVSSRYKNEVFGRHKLTAMIYDQQDVNETEPSAPASTVILHRYRLGGKSANGGNNTIRQAVDEQTDDQVAVKFFQNFESFEREVVMLKYLRSRYVGELLALYELPSKIDWPYIAILNYYPQSLDSFILSKLSTMDTLFIKLIIKSITQAIHYLHKHNVAHLDVKPGNFVHEAGDVTSWRLIDFEAARFIGEETVDDCSPLYSSPEVLHSAQTQSSIIATTSMDMWSLGCIIYELYTNTPLFYSQDEAIEKLTTSYTNGESTDLSLNKVADLQARNMLEKLLSIKPSNRISCEQVLRSAFLNSGLDTKQLNNLHSESTEKIITAVNQNTNLILSTMQETTNLILSQIDAVINSITDTMDAAIPRLYILLPGKETSTIFNPKSWTRNTFILHVLCEGLDPGNREAHFTTHSGYTIHDPKPMLAKAGPYLSIVATIISAGVERFIHLNMPKNISGLISQITSRPTEYFQQLTKLLDQAVTSPEQAREIENARQDPIARMKVVRGPALREFQAFLEKNDPARQWGGLQRVVLNDGRWRWVCHDCHQRAYAGYQHSVHENKHYEGGMAM
ncbi:585_t:CDS:2 [Ambispora leptoticha]|uniref:585_t:CDS:1 n=1 Tax=Ambispora leptoticha TaxID=144679 RepID=A0A9N8ZPP9_9GLOM|nr:585_t:CDS:2 [Ambispora leptoticha]